MKPEILAPHGYRLAMLLLLAMTVGGCAGMQSFTSSSARPQSTSPPPADSSTPDSKKSICGTLFDYVLDIHRLDGQQKSASINELVGEGSPRYFCDTIKTGILLSQISRTSAEDDVAISILNKYSGSKRLSEDERWLLRLLKAQSRERRRLHLLLGQFSDKLVEQESLNTNLSTELLTLRKKLYQLQKIEADINETEQSIATPAATSDQRPTESPGS